MPDFAYPPPSGQSPFPNLRPGPDPGLLPGPGFTGDRNPLPSGPAPYPSVPLPGSQPTLSPLAEAYKIYQSGQQDPGLLSMIRMKHAYPSLQVGNFQYPGQGGPGAVPPPGWAPNVPATTVGELTWRDIGGPAANLAPAAIAPLEQARMMQNFQRFGANLLPFGLGTIPGSMAGLPTPPQQPGGYPTMPGGGPMPYDPSLPVGGGNVSPGMPGSPPNQYPFTPPAPPTYQRPLPPGTILPPGVAYPQAGVPYPQGP